MFAIRIGSRQRQTILNTTARQLSKNCMCADNGAASSTCAHAPHTTKAQRVESEIRRDFGYPAKYHGGSFPWLLSAERQRTPMEDLETSALLHAKDIRQNAGIGDGAVSAAVGVLPLLARRTLAYTLNMRVARAALGAAAMDSVCDGAAAVLPRVASLLSSASRCDVDAPEELSRVFTGPLLAHYMRDLDRLRRDHVRLDLKVHSVENPRLQHLRTHTGPEAAFAALNGAAQVSSLRAGLTRQKYRYTSVLGATHAAPYKTPLSWSAAMMAAIGGQAQVRVRIDVELMVHMRYRLINKHNGVDKTIVDDDATRNLVLTLESTAVDAAEDQPQFEWRVADIDYLLSSERRIESEFVEAKLAEV
ncbi:hypothetical protein LPJ58_005829 [Coemansia sp. RSA 1591]|nr:hypothetical protein LPJ58_005829 [Coemansia sp. RSA 1591]KAJ1780885.1 hypothetical protein LPJ67_005715 [Coemansia sp. RSA 1938]